MSVRNTKLIMYGAEIQYAHYQMLCGEDESKYDELDIFYSDEQGKVGILSDGMNGDYAVVGTILLRTDDNKLLPEGVTPLDELFGITLSKERQAEIEKSIEPILGFKPRCKLLFVNHWH